MPLFLANLFPRCGVWGWAGTAGGLIFGNLVGEFYVKSRRGRESGGVGENFVVFTFCVNAARVFALWGFKLFVFTVRKLLPCSDLADQAYTN